MSGMTTQVGESNVLYLTIAQGNMVEKSTEDNPEAKKRIYKKADDSEGVKWEIHHRNLTGRVTGIEFKDSDYGQQFVLTMSAGVNKAKLTVGTDSNYFTDFAKRFKSVDLDKDITINPYDMELEGGKKNRGISVKQDGEKVMNGYWDGEKTLHDFPQADEETRNAKDKDLWKIFFINVKKFLVKQMEAVELPEFKAEIDMSSDVIDQADKIEEKPSKNKKGKKTNEKSDLPF